MRNYIGLIHRAADGDFGVTFPDFPGVTTAGATLDEARSAAQEVLARHIAGRTEAMPAPSTLEEVMADPDNRNGVVILTCIKPEQARAIRVNVTMPEDVLTQLDRYAAAHGFTRSRLLTQAAKRLLAGAA